MKQKTLSIFKRLLLRYRQWKSSRDMKMMNTMIVYSFDEAVRLANRKRDSINHKTWVVSGNSLFLVFARYQKMNLQREGLLKKHLTGKDLDEMASYVAYPITEHDRSRKAKIRKFAPPDLKVK